MFGLQKLDKNLAQIVDLFHLALFSNQILEFLKVMLPEVVVDR